MPHHIAAGLRFPHERVFLHRTKLAYVHLRNLLTDAKRDRGARVFGYVAIWLADDFQLLYLQEGELVNATSSHDGRSFSALPISEAVAKVPSEPEYGEILFHEAADEQLACMFAAQVTDPLPWPHELDPTDPKALFPYLMATTFDGTLDVAVGSAHSYLVLRNGAIVRTFIADDGQGTAPERVKRLFMQDVKPGEMQVRHWPVPAPLPVQAAPALIQAYRDLVSQLATKLIGAGCESALAIAEHARQTLLERHPCLLSFSATGDRHGRDPVADTAQLTAGVAAWISEVLWTTSDHETIAPETLLRDLTRDRRHMLASAGLFESLPWKVQW